MGFTTYIGPIVLCPIGSIVLGPIARCSHLPAHVDKPKHELHSQVRTVVITTMLEYSECTLTLRQLCLYEGSRFKDQLEVYEDLYSAVLYVAAVRVVPTPGVGVAGVAILAIFLESCLE